MALYAIGDLHLSPNNSKPMDIFGWENHKQRVFDYWTQVVKEEDVVIICGDTSWAMRFEEVIENLDEINALPGKKIILKGNHDYWWQSLSKMKKVYPEIFFLQNNCYVDDNYVIFGTRGWIVPGSSGFLESDNKIFEREKARLKLSFDAFVPDEKPRLRIVAMHYPPIDESGNETDITKIIQDHQIDHMVYGHLHGPESFKNLYQGKKDQTLYHLVSADYLEFTLKKISD